MTPPRDQLFQDIGEDPMSDRRSPGEALVTIALNLMRTVDARLERLENKFDQAGEDKLKEAEATGKMKAELELLKDYKRVHTEDHKWLWRALVMAVLTAAGAMAVAFLKGGK